MNIKRYFAQKRETKRKKRFVGKFLRPLIINAGLYVCDVRYKKVGGLETVTVTYNSGSEVVADVSCDSLISLCRDTLKIL